ncbi:hypothetical protein [Delftia sp. HK171]|uniref:hypothetical protein n=1 Tax=Delftia sp. HK171 TaxID=1920191 RepID=UPI0011535CC9|nr:hypothetical protein [Delftia sp. HK171]
MEIITKITDWPVIIQGALGSALFWIIIELGQRVAKSTTARFSKDKQAGNAWALMAHEAKGPHALQAKFICMYAALHYLLKAGVVATLSFVIGNSIEIFSSVGFLISTYFLFRALSYVPHTTSWGTLEDRAKAYQRMLDEAPAKLKALKEVENREK